MCPTSVGGLGWDMVEHFCLGRFERKGCVQPFLSNDRDKTGSVARKRSTSAPQTDAMTFALPSVSILLLWGRGCISKNIY